MTKRHYLGIDIGGTNTRVVVLKGLGRQRVEAMKFPTPRTMEKLDSSLLDHAKKLVRGRRVAGIGISVAGVVNQKESRVIVAEHTAFLNKGKVASSLARAFRAPLKVENDARCFLLAEALWGAVQKKSHVLAIVIGTGVGGAIMIGGKQWRGAHEAAGEVGDIRLDRGVSFDGEAAKSAYKKWGNRSRVVGDGIAQLLSVLDPEIVVLGGGAVAEGKINLQAVRRVVKSRSVTPAVGGTPIVAGELGDTAQAIGAALLFAQWERR